MRLFEYQNQKTLPLPPKRFDEREKTSADFNTEVFNVSRTNAGREKLSEEGVHQVTSYLREGLIMGQAIEFKDISRFPLAVDDPEMTFPGVVPSPGWFQVFEGDRNFLLFTIDVR